ncbi:MAG: HupE/UreJ family protein [Acidiferrobacterales bacterium]
MRRPLIALTTLALLGISPAAFAHPGHLTGSGFATGLLHPFTGLDHLLAMLAVGLWATQRGGRYLFVIPASFMAMMAVGAVAGTAGITLPLVEPGILGSLLVFGLLIAFDARLPLAAGMVVIGGFALFHGYAHAVEMSTHASLAVFGSGMLLGSLALHLLGIGAGRMGKKQIHETALRLSGGLIALVGMALFAVA